MSANEDNHYIERIINGDTAAFAFLVEKYKNMAFTIAVNIVKDAEDAEEIAQDCFIKVYKALPRFKRQSKFSTWLYRIVYNASIDKSRRRQNFQSVDLEEMHYDLIEDGLNELELMTAREQQEIVQKAVKRLPEDESLVITLFYLEELSVEEVSDITGFSASNVKVKLFRARKKLFNELTYFRKVI